MDNAFSSVIIESMSDGVLVFDFQGYITHINPAGLDILGLRAEDVQGRTYVQLFMEEPENDAFNDILIRGIQERESRLYQEVPFRREDGRLLDLGVTTSFLRLEAENWDTPGIVMVFKDITQFKALDRARRRVLDHLSHELRTPLSIAAASLRSLETPENRKTLDRIRRNLKRLQDIQMDVEDIVRAEGADREHGFKPCVEQTLDLLHVLAEEDPAQVNALKTVEKMVAAHLPFGDIDLNYERPSLTSWLEKRMGDTDRPLTIGDLMDLGFDPTRLKEIDMDGLPCIFERIQARQLPDLKKKDALLAEIGSRMHGWRIKSTSLHVNRPLLTIRDRGNAYVLRRKIGGIHWEEAVEQIQSSPCLKTLDNSLKLHRMIAGTVKEAHRAVSEELNVAEEVLNDLLSCFVSWEIKTNRPLIMVDFTNSYLTSIWMA